MNNDIEREAFERHYASMNDGFCPAIYDGEYDWGDAQACWLTWQAARAHDSCQGFLDSSDANPFITLTIVETEPGNLMIRKWRTHGPVSAGEYELYTASQPAEQNPDVTQLVEALECALETMENVDGANDCSRGIDAVEEALAAHRKQGGGQ